MSNQDLCTRMTNLSITNLNGKTLRLPVALNESAAEVFRRAKNEFNYSGESMITSAGSDIAVKIQGMTVADVIEIYRSSHFAIADAGILQE